MADYTKATGSGGTMMIRDTGTSIEFWIKAGASTWINGATYGGSASGSFNLPSGGAWLKIRSWVQPTSATITFTLNATGTSGLGGPTTLSAAITRGTIPPAPDAPVLSALTTTSMTSVFTGNGDGGAAMVRWEIGWGTSSVNPTVIRTSSGTYGHVSLVPGTVYYFWSRGVNTVGTGAWSARSTATTRKLVPAPTAPGLSSVTTSSIYAGFASQGDGIPTVDSWEIGYGTSPSYPQYSYGASAGVIGGLAPGTTYYFWGRGHNSQGWGPYSAVAAATTLKLVPSPNQVVISDIKQSSVYAVFSGNGDGVPTADAWEIGYGTNPAGPTSTFPSYVGTITGLTPGATYYFWARGHNSVGWGPYSAVTAAKTIAGVRINVAGVWKDAVPYVRDAGVWKVAEGWAKIAGLWKKTG
jgi:hypothetical protein